MGLDAFSNSSQRKFIRTSDGVYHLVYESMGKIWYERSTDGGTTWTLGNNGKPLNTDYVYTSSGQYTGTGSYTVAKEPSLDYYQNKIFITWEEQSGSNYVIRVTGLGNTVNGNGVLLGPANSIPFQSYGSYSENVYPQIAIKDDCHAMVAIKRNDPYFKGIEVHYLSLFPENGMVSDECSGTISGTDQNTGSFTIAADRTSDKYHVAWQEIVSSSESQMKYAKLNFTYESGGVYSPAATGVSADPALLPGDYYWQMNTVETVNVSNSTWYDQCFSPSMIGVTDGTVRLAFMGYDGSYYVSSCCPDNLSWIPYLNRHGGQIYSPQISLGSDTYFVGWTEYYNGAYKTICTDSHTLRDLETVNNSLGRDMQINNGGTKDQQFSMSFNSESSALPYVFRRSDAIGTIVANKKLEISSGRGIFLTSGKSQLYFTLGNIKADGVNVDFIKSQDTVKLDGNLKKVNSYLKTEPFTLNDNSNLSFAAVYGLRDSLVTEASMKEGDFASFAIELIDDASGRVLGSYLNEKIDKNNIFNLKEASFRVNPEGIGNRLVRLSVSVKENMKSQYTISDLFLGSGMVLSKNLQEKELGLEGSLAASDYSLSQNYPNPFNPSTVISFTIPRASKVSLRIYDILGKEVANLVEDFKEKGKYSVEFNAKNLPSGIYIYELRANDFVKSGKMMLLK